MAQRQKSQSKNTSLIDISTILKYFFIWIILALVCYGIKIVVMQAFELSPTGQVGNGILRLYEVHNTGAAFNLFAGQQDMIISASFIAVLIITLVCIFSSGKLSQTAVSAMSALSAGITMNLYERISQGYVIDYIYCEFMHDFPMFNVPDIMIVVGAICLILSIFTKR